MPLFLILCIGLRTGQLHAEVREGESAIYHHVGIAELALAPTSTLNLTDSMTLETWIKPDGWGEGPNYLATIFHKTSIWLFIVQNHNTANDRSLILQLRHNARVSHTYSELGSIVLDMWTHIAVSYNGTNSEVTMLINGITQNVSHISTPEGPIRDNGAEALRLGSVQGGIMGFMGVIDEVRIWNEVRTESEIIQNMSSVLTGHPAGLQLYWPMNEGGGDSLHDMSGNGNDMRISGVDWTYGTPFHPTSVEDPIPPAVFPETSSLTNNYPNPFNPGTAISYTLVEAVDINLTVYDIKGVEVMRLASGYHETGHYTVYFTPENLSSGTYLYVLDAGSFRDVKRMVYLK